MLIYNQSRNTIVVNGINTILPSRVEEYIMATDVFTITSENGLSAHITIDLLGDDHQIKSNGLKVQVIKRGKSPDIYVMN